MFIFHPGFFYSEQEPLITGHRLTNVTKIHPPAPFLHCLTSFTTDVSAFRQVCRWICVPACAGDEAQHTAVVPQEPGLGLCDSHIALLGVASIPGPGAWPQWLCPAASPKLCPEEEGLGNGLKARVDSSFPGPGCSSQVAGCAVDPSHSLGFHLKVIPRPYHQASLLGVILSRTERLQSGIDCCLPHCCDEPAT